MGADHEEGNGALEAIDQSLQGLQVRLQEIKGLIGLVKETLDKEEGRARELAVKLGWAGESQESQR